MNLRDRWAELASRPDERFALDEAALIIAAHIDPATDVDAELSRLDALASTCRDQSLEGLSDLLFDRLGLRGDTLAYDDPANSALPQVLNRGIGIPISLSVLMIEVGRRLGVACEGVGLPGHFLVRHVSEHGATPVLIDPFGAGRHLDAAACRAMFTSIKGSAGSWSPDLLAATPPMAITVRMLANLTASYTRRDDLAGRRWVAELRSALHERSPNQRLIVASELAQTGAFDAAAEILTATADHLDRAGGDHPDATRLRAQARGVRARLN